MRSRIAAAFAAVYIIWGSTYLAIRFVIETLPPFFMAGTRFAVAGLALYAWARIRGSSGPTMRQWGMAVLIGGLMLMGGHGAVVWAEQSVPSGLASLLVGTVPLWIALLDWIWHRSKPNIVVAAGLVLGFAGVSLLVGGVAGLGASSVDVVNAGIVVVGASLWAGGSLYSRSAKLPTSALLGTGMEMVAGGALLLMASLLTGEWTRVRLDLVSTRSLVSWGYLVVFGSIVAFTSYTWLLKATTPAKVSTYAYVNPIVALFLGWALASEPLTMRNAFAAGVILASVVLITTYQKKRPRVGESSTEEETPKRNQP